MVDDGAPSSPGMWVPPMEGVLKLNTDATYSINQRKYELGVVVRGWCETLVVAC